MRICALLTIASIAALLASCSVPPPIVPDQEGSIAAKEKRTNESPRWIWGSWRFHVPSDHNSISIAPVRNAARHFNVKILLEQSPCDNCIWIKNFNNNGDGTVSITVSIRHPFPGCDYYTGFDVRGILLLPAHYKVGNPNYPNLGSRSIPSLSEGDPELLNPDGFTEAFVPILSGEGPIFEYQPGGDLGGTYDAEDYFEYGGSHLVPIWPFICYYSDEARRHFSSSAVVSRTYHLALPPGEWEFGYTIDACWAPPDNVPVKDVVEDFPKNANTLQDYRIEILISGPLVGDEPSLLKITAYKHFPDLLEHTTLASIFACCLDGWILPYWVYEPALTTDEYYEYHFELRNILNRPPGEYPIIARTLAAGDDYYYLKSIDPNWNSVLSGFYQVLWVTVES